MTQRPRIFISAVSKELYSARQLVANTLLALGYEPLWQDIVPTGQGDICAILRSQINSCEALVQIVGHCYGLEPPEPGESFGRVSYTQYEAHYSRSKGLKVWYLLLDDDFATDSYQPEPEDLRGLQEAYRQRVLGSEQLFHPLRNADALEAKIFRLRNELAALRRRGKQWAVLVLTLLGVVVLGLIWLKRDLWQQRLEGEQNKEELLQQIQAQPAKMLAALREFPSTLSQTTLAGRKDQESARLTRAYAALEEKLNLPKGTLERELPKFAEVLLTRADTSSMDRASALFATRKFAQAETEALLAKDKALAVAGKPVQDAIMALEVAGNAAREQLQYARSLEHLRAAVALTDEKRDPLEWARVQNEIGWVYYLQGRYEEEAILVRQAWLICSSAGYTEDRVALDSHNKLAEALYGQGKDLEAEHVNREVLAIRERMFGAEHPDTLDSRNNLAEALDHQGKHDEAEREYRRVLAIRERVLGAEHPDSLETRNDLASCLNDQGRYAEAEKESRATLAIQERILGSGHPDTLNTRDTLAEALIGLGRFVEAEGEERRVLNGVEPVLGSNHPDVLYYCYNIARALQGQNKSEEAMPFARRAVEGASKGSAPDQPDAKRYQLLMEALEAEKGK